jgi:hypothetical protein
MAGGDLLLLADVDHGLDEPVALIGAIGRTALTGRLPQARRRRLKARVRKRDSTYTSTADLPPTSTRGRPRPTPSASS